MTIVDNLFRGHAAAVEAVGRASGVKVGGGRLSFHRAALTNQVEGWVMSQHKVEAVLHFAAMTYVGESVSMPAEYWRVNTGGVAALLQAAESAGVKRLVFSVDSGDVRRPCPERGAEIKETLERDAR